MSTPALPELRVSLPEAREKITAQIKRGREIRDSVRPLEAGGLIAFGLEGAFERAQTNQEKWAKYTIDLLKSCFSGDSIVNEFGDWPFVPHSVHYNLKRFGSWIEIRIVRLESILERLDLFPIAERKVEVLVAQAKAKPLSKDIAHVHDEAAKPQNFPSESKRPGPHMKVFISWSGPLSHRVALSLRDWLPVVLPCIDPWVSSEDIPKGTRWGTELASELEGTHSGIISLVPDNLTEPWLNFEAGALSKSVATARIHPFLFGVEPRELPGPLAQFQATRFSKEDLRKLIHALNLEAAEAVLPTSKVDKAFGVCWPDLERQLTPLLTDTPTDRARTKTDTRKAERDLTEDELKILRMVANSNGLHPFQAAEVVPLHQQRIRHIMESLQEEGLLDTFLNDMGSHSWHLSKGGRAFLVKMNLL